jgi:hypothetical protein
MEVWRGRPDRHYLFQCRKTHLPQIDLFRLLISKGFVVMIETPNFVAVAPMILSTSEPMPDPRTNPNDNQHDDNDPQEPKGDAER